MYAVLLLALCLFRPADLARFAPLASLLDGSERDSRVVEPFRHEVVAASPVRVQPLRIPGPNGRPGDGVVSRTPAVSPARWVSRAASQPILGPNTRTVEHYSGRSPPNSSPA